MQLALIIVIDLILGTFIGLVSVVLITVPVFLTLTSAPGFDLIRFAVLSLIATGIGLITPPFGLLLFVLKGQAPNAGCGQVIRAWLPFLVCRLMLLGLVIAFPDLALALPSHN